MSRSQFVHSTFSNLLLPQTEIGFLEREIKSRKQKFGVDAYGRPNRGAGRMNAPPMEAPPQQGMKNKGGGGRPPSGGGGGRREPSLFDKVSNFVADSGTIAVLKVSYYHYHYIIIARWEWLF